MQDHILIADEKYEGKYVALRSVVEQEVVAFGDNPVTVVDEAKKDGATSPLLIYVPKKDESFVF